MVQVLGLRTRISILFFGIICVFILAAGCASQNPFSVAISPQVVAIGTGQTVQFTPIVTNDSSAVTWSATAGTIDANGNYTAPSGSQSMTVTVTATAVKDHSKSASAIVNVVAPGQVTPRPTRKWRAIPLRRRRRETSPCSLAPIRTTALRPGRSRYRQGAGR